ncbi:MAG: phosphate/phosphite/phosphonate ABC transporter substrate-binding protein [Aquificaceae bacterium]|nr:phosphate/phosphite/phosphonate ABC transporter substrate-binding protein [Aquificaceae bacterium]
MVSRREVIVYGGVGLASLLSSPLRAVAQQKNCLVFGLIPAEDPRSMIEQFTPMAKWMEKEMGRCIQLFTATDYTGVIEAMRAKKVDLAWFGAFSYVVARERANAEAFAVGVDAKGSHTYRSVLVARSEVAKQLGIDKPFEGEEGMKRIAEILNPHKKKFNFVFTDVNSTSGYAVPRYYMHRVGIDPRDYFKNVSFIGTHDAAQMAIRRDVADIAADSDTSYNKMIEQGKITRDTNVLIWLSPPIPSLPIAYRKDLPEDVKKALRETIVKVPKDVIAGWGKPVAYKIIPDKEYDVMLEVKRVIDDIRAKGGV